MVSSESIKSKAVKGLYWNTLERFGSQGIQFIISIILARLLDPAEFGILAMVFLFITLSQVIVNSGFGAALIYNQDTTSKDESSVFWFNVFISLILVGLLYVTAPLIAEFYNERILINILRLMSLSIFFNSFSIVQMNLLTKELKFKEQTFASILSIVISGSVGIFLAYQGYGVFSLVWQYIIASIVTTSYLWLAYRWRPSIYFSIKNLSTLFNYGSKLLLSSILDAIFSNLYYVIIGRIYSPQILGYYTRARNTQNFPVINLTAIISKITFPILSCVQKEPEKLKQGFHKALVSSSFVLFPILTGIIVTASPLTEIVFGSKWLPSVYYLQLFCIVGFLFPVHAINLNLLMALGKTGIFFRLEVIKKILFIIGILFTYNYGVVWLIYGEIIASIVSLFVNTYYTKKYINFSLFAQFKSILPLILACITMGILTYCVTLLTFPTVFLLLLTQVVIGTTIYLMISYFFRFIPFAELIHQSNISWLQQILQKNNGPAINN